MSCCWRASSRLPAKGWTRRTRRFFPRWGMAATSTATPPALPDNTRRRCSVPGENRRERAKVMDTALSALLAELVADLERRAPYAAALYTSASGARASLDNREQSVNPQDPKIGRAH